MKKRIYQMARFVTCKSQVSLCCLLLVIFGSIGYAQTRSTSAQTSDVQSVIARQASLVTEFEINGLKVLVKRREGSQTVAAGLFLRGGSRNITAENAGIEALMLDVATEASASYPRQRLRSELARTGTVIGSSENYDYSVLAFTSTRANFDSTWNIFVDVALHPAFTKEDFDLVKARKLSALADDADDPERRRRPSPDDTGLPPPAGRACRGTPGIGVGGAWAARTGVTRSP